MDVFDLRKRLVDDYKSYTRSFIKIRDEQIKRFVDGHLDGEGFWPEPLLQLNPAFSPGGTIDDLVEQGVLMEECSRIFRVRESSADRSGSQLPLHRHQREAILAAHAERSYVLTTGTGSGKSLGYIVPIVDRVLRNGSGRGVQAIIVYPMNALANSQHEELGKFIHAAYPPDQAPVRFARYTGQEGREAREHIRNNPPDVLLTNYMMLELMLTRLEDRQLVKAAQGLRFLVFDELHTYRGRQGADVAMLIRRCRHAVGNNVICVGTSATMANDGTADEQRRAVAEVAQLLFGLDFTPQQVIGETLKRATPEVDPDVPAVRAELGAAVAGEAPPDDYDRFRRHPLTSWIESTFGVREAEAAGGLIRQSPRRLDGATSGAPQSAAAVLAQLTGAGRERCAAVLRRWLLKGSTLRKDSKSRFPIFAFRLHQFLTRGDTVWASLEPARLRHLEIAKQAAKPGDPRKPLYPLVFCRHCGTAYYRVRIAEEGNGRTLIPREDDRPPDAAGDTNGYLYVSEESPWPHAGDPSILERLPDSLKETRARGGERIRADASGDVPEPVFVDAGGSIVAEGNGIPAALIPRRFLFCLEPSCGVAYTRSQRSERFKLATLGVDNRSTATTILAMRSLIELQRSRDLERAARKLLSFTDNRQDASLQAGHFNDFVQVALLRSALCRACAQGPPAGLRHGDLSRHVLDAMALRFDDYAADPEVRGPARQRTEDALRRVLEYLLYRDLERGWRVTAPNLEDCGLLGFDYEGLCGADGLLGEAALWETGFAEHTVPAALRAAPADLREELVRTLLDLLRRQLAVKVDVLDPGKQHDLVEQTKPRLLEGTAWFLEDEQELIRAMVAWPRSRRKREQAGLFVSSYSAYGQYLRRRLSEDLPNQRLSRDETDELVRFLFLALKRYGIVEQVRSGSDADDPGYQLNADALRWLPGSGEDRPLDRIRLLDEGSISQEVNRYFVECYRNFVDLKYILEAREHTAQVATEDRQERENRFRDGKLPLLFCSPTMELGVDIRQLNLVNLRNVPPTPANYAQRSGRAGRSGQPALVFTYCAGRSPHDQYFYREPPKMVAGTVTPPRIDLRNRDLIRSHVHAIWMETAKPDLGKTLAEVLDLTSDERKLPLPVLDAIKEELRSPFRREAARKRIAPVIAEIRTDLAQTSWFHDAWVDEVLGQLELTFDAACERWRNLYRAAVSQRKFHHDIIGDHSRSEAERNHSRRLRAQAESQIRLLTEAEGVYEGDFYSYRYFATEGFLPGYNFPRLPVSAYVPGRRGGRGRDEFISRPRFLAVEEFAPRALIYHEGARYRVYKANLDFGADSVENARELTTDTMKRCATCGYAHYAPGATNLTEVCDRCGGALEGPARIDGLVRMQNVSLRLAQRITCDEEERQRFGYRLIIAYRFPDVNGQPDRKDAEVYCDGKRALRLSYGDATDLYRINLGWTKQDESQPRGFNLDLERGYWSSNQADAGDQDHAATPAGARVVPFVSDTKNVLVIRFDAGRSGPEMAGLQAAFKQAIQLHFQIEPRELAGEPMPDPDDRREILFYEATEGGAGVLRQVAEDASILPALARRALEICHYDPDSLADQAAARCGRACYQCLLDYGNQPDHKDLDRELIRDTLAALARSECRPAGGAGSRPERMAALRERCDSRLERRWLDRVDELGVRLPSHAQYDLPGYFTQPDFFYDDANAVIYVDGPPHDKPEQLRDDDGTTQALIERGYIVIRFHHADDWDDIFRRHSDVFGAPRT